ncbi:(2Fe-2S)-binding protein [Virgibacillus ndiopensis]|uniref:(2Fe-2S)-binding protein n=1 Tax=Virgibacillus ndiopensis TaxID=2004408 RepID=UPI000C088974|nr:(2Fe-2S)-binding protein [Virgibacillus ndiopensis]
MQIVNHSIPGKKSEKEITFSFNDKFLKAREGQTVAAALMANGIKKFGISRKLQQPRGLFCANGRCCSCFLTVNGLNHVLGCITLVEEGMKVSSNDADPDVRRKANGD